MRKSEHKNNADILYASLGKLPEAVKNPVLVLLSGLPGTGKTPAIRGAGKRCLEASS
jgi:ATP-dependent 26S proteasome regulatory subunit